MEVNGIVLAGGKSVRLRHNKIAQIIGQKSLLDRVVSQVCPLCHEVIIVTGREGKIPEIDSCRARVLRDVIADKGPLGGIYTGLEASDCFYNLVVASDMPFINRSLLEYMVQISEGFDMVVPALDSLFEPLHAVYSKNCLAPIKHLIHESQLGIHGLLALVKVRYVERDEIERFDPQHLSFFNINTAADLEKARELARGLALNDNG